MYDKRVIQYPKKAERVGGEPVPVTEVGMKANIRAGMLTVLMVSSACTLTGCGKSNIFAGAHNSGSSSDSKALSSDAYAALINKDYAEALECYNKLLETDPKNAEAIYGYASAELANSGLDIATLVANLIKQHNSSNVQARNLAEAIASSAGMSVQSPGTNILPSTIITNLLTIRTAVENVLRPDRLPLIVNGGTDGSLAPDDPNVNINLAFCYILHAAVVLNDVVVFDSDYNAIVTNQSQLNAAANTAADDLVKAYNCLVSAANKLNLASDSTITNVKDNVKTLFDNLNATGTVTITATIN